MTTCKSVLGGHWWYYSKTESQPIREEMRAKGKVVAVRTKRRKGKGWVRSIKTPGLGEAGRAEDSPPHPISALSGPRSGSCVPMCGKNPRS